MKQNSNVVGLNSIASRVDGQFQRVVAAHWPRLPAGMKGANEYDAKLLPLYEGTDTGIYS